MKRKSISFLFTVFCSMLFTLLGHDVIAQIENTPPDSFSLPGESIFIDNEAVNVSAYPGGFVFRSFGHGTYCVVDTILISDGYVKSFAPKTGPTGRNKFVAVFEKNGRSFVRILTITGTCPRYSYSVDTTYYVDLSTSGNAVMTKAEGDDIYGIYGGMLSVLRTGAAHWAWDTTGLRTGGMVSDFALDTAQNVYVIDPLGLFYQTAAGNTWTRIAAYPGTGGSDVFVDRSNRLFVANGNNVYSSTNGGSTWATGTVGSNVAGRFGDDALGNIYTTNGSTAYRSANGGATWTRIDQPITGQAWDPALTSIIHGISGDTAIFAATSWGLYQSTDQGTTWQQANEGNHGIPHGFWLFSNGRMVASTGLGTFIKNTADTAWTQTWPTGGKFQNTGSIQGDTIGNIYTVIKWNNGQNYMPMKSSDQGATWQADTAGIAQIPQPQYSSCYYDEYGNAHIAGVQNTNASILYTKTAGGSYVVDTAGISAYLQYFGSNFTFSSDHRGYLYTSAFNAMGLGVWRRPVNGGTWISDTAGYGNHYLTQIMYDQHGGIIGYNSGGTNYLYHNSGGVWTAVPFPASVTPSYASAIAGDPSGGILAAFYLPSTIPGSGTSYGVYCTHDLGATWTEVPHIDSSYVHSMETIGDTTYIINDKGLYKLTCSGILINPTGIVASDDGYVVRLYPNPVSGECHISMTDVMSESSTLLIQDLTGRVVKNITLTEHVTTFSTNDMNAGMYLCTITSGGKVMTTRKLVVE